MALAAVEAVPRVSIVVASSVLLGMSSATLAQPAASEPAAAGASASTPEPVRIDPFGGDGWPFYSLEDLRGLPECPLYTTPPAPGEEFRCHPPVRPADVHWSLAAEWGVGLADAAVPLLHSAQSLGVGVDFWLTRGLGLGARYELVGLGTPGAERPTGLSNQFLAEARYRLFTDEVDRDAWVVGAGAGYALRSDAMGGAGTLVRASLGRDIGMYLQNRSALTLALELAYEQALDDSALRAVIVSARGGFELGIREPRNVGEPDDYPFHYTFGTELRAFPPSMGFGFAFGLPLGRRFALRLDADYALGFHWSDGKLHGLRDAMFGVVGGVRWWTGWPEAVPLYLEGAAGYAWITKDPALDDGAVADGELGLRVYGGCSGAIDLGVRVRGRPVDQGLELLGGTIVLRFEYGAGQGSLATSAWADAPCAAERPVAPVEPAPVEPAPVEPAPVAQPVDGSIRGDGGLDASGGGEASGGVAGAGVAVEVTPAAPVEIVVELGAVLLGGAIDVRIDPSVLPIDRLLAAGHIEVTLEGPAEALSSYERELAATCRARGITISSWQRRVVDEGVVRARFLMK